MSAHLLTVNRLTDISSVEALKRGRVSAARLLLRPTWRFLRSLFLDRGILEGWPGFFVAATAGFYVFLKYAKALELRELHGRGAEAEGWFRGPPYAVVESVFDENDIEGCAPGPGKEDA